MKKLLTAILLILLTSSMVWAMGQAAEAKSQNLLNNPSFEDGITNNIPIDWGNEYYNCTLSTNSRDGKYSLKIENASPAESLGAQEIEVDGRKINKLTVSVWVKANNIVPGKIAWQKANVQPLFFDENGKQVGGWPELGPWEGSFDWKFVKKSFVVPSEARKLKLVFGLYACQGEIYFDDFKVYKYQETKIDPNNLVSHGDFEIWEDWAYGGIPGGGVVSPGFNGDGMLKISNPIPNWSFASQSIALDGRKIKEVKISGNIKLENVVAGKKPWQKARINIEFKDKSGKRLGGWPIIAQFDGTFDWKKVENTFPVPEETRRVDLFVGLLECSGTLWADDIFMEGYLRSGGRAIRTEDFITDKKDFYAFNPAPDTFVQNATDMRFLLDAPAGKHGFLQVKNGHFYFQDGTRVRFWGTNLYGVDALVDKKTAKQLALRLAKNGCNLVRLHHLDAHWADPNIFDKNYDDTRHLSKEQLDKLDYLIYELKKQGIYVFMDLLVDRKFKSGDGVADYKNVETGAKITGFYNDKIIRLQKEFAKQLLHHYNPYTKKRYVDDPIIVSVKIINEAMLYYLPTQVGISKIYLDELDKQWNAWLKKKYGSTAKLRNSWTDKYGRCDLLQDESIEKGSVTRGETQLKFQRSGYEKVEHLRDQDTMKFYYDLQVAYYKDMESYLKSLGVKVPLSGSNHWVNIAADVKSNSSLDYIDRHRYWDHPKYGYGTDIVFENLPMVKYPEEALPNNFAYYNVAGKPYCISEWNCSFPNEFRAEGPIIMAAYANLQDWDAVLQFSFNKDGWHAPIRDNFDISGWPNTLTLWPAATMLFYRGDVSKAKYVIEEGLSNNDIFGQIYEDNTILNNPYLPLITRTQLRFVETAAEASVKGDYKSILDAFLDKDKKTLTSDTQELTWDWGNGLFMVDTKRSQAAVGFLGDSYVNLSNLNISAKNKFAVITLSSLSKQPISTSKHLLLTAVGRIENTGQKYNGSKTQITEVGKSPLQVEGINATITIKRPVSSALIYALDYNGNRVEKVNFKISDKNLTFNISSNDKTCFYEVILR